MEGIGEKIRRHLAAEFTEGSKKDPIREKYPLLDPNKIGGFDAIQPPVDLSNSDILARQNEGLRNEINRDFNELNNATGKILEKWSDLLATGKDLTAEQLRALDKKWNEAHALIFYLKQSADEINKLLDEAAK